MAKPGKTSSGIAAGLEKLGLRRPLDFVLHLPLRYEDQTRITLLSDAPAAGPALFAVKVRNVAVAFRPKRQLLVQVEDESGRANCRFLNFYGSQTKQFERARDEGLTLHAWGELRSGYLGPELVHPTISKPAEETAATPPSATLTPQYPTTAGVSQTQLRQRIGKVLKDLMLANTLPLGTFGHLVSSGTVGLLSLAVGVEVASSMVVLLGDLLRQALSVREQ